MKYPTRTSDAAHIMIFIQLNPTQDLSSGAIAHSIKTNPSYVRQLMSALKKAGLLYGKQGQARPSLARETGAITLLDIYRAVEGDKPLLHLDTHTNPECGVGVKIQMALSESYQQVQKSAESRMAEITVADIIQTYLTLSGLTYNGKDEKSETCVEKKGEARW